MALNKKEIELPTQKEKRMGKIIKARKVIYSKETHGWIKYEEETKVIYSQRVYQEDNMRKALLGTYYC